jgi:hypothetical protein
MVAVLAACSFPLPSWLSQACARHPYMHTRDVISGLQSTMLSMLLLLLLLLQVPCVLLC